ncbi:hypothetical protein MASR1M45_15990 [Candidatus Kapaibacterium sp.]
MKNLQLFFSVLMFFAVSTLHSQWLEKEGYWELEQNYGQLLDIKLNETTNELWIVTTDNKVIAIDAETGIEVKRCQCEIDSNQLFAKISNDLQSVIFSKYKQNDNTSKMFINDVINEVWNINNCSRISNLVVKIDTKNNYFAQSSSMNFANYIISKKILILGLSQSASWHGTGPNEHYGTIGSFLVYELNQDTFQLKFSIGRNSYYSTLPNIKNNIFYFTNDYFGGQSWTNSGGGGVSYKTSYLSMFDIANYKLQDTLEFRYSTSYGAGQDNLPKGYYIPLADVITTLDDKIIYIKSDKKMFTLNLADKKFSDSLTFDFKISSLILSNTDDYLHGISGNSLFTYNLKFKQIISQIILPISINQYLIDEKNGIIFIANSDNKIRYIKPDILKQVPDIGFLNNKNLIYTGNSIKYSAICNIDSCEYEWEFTPDKITKTKSKEIEYSYDSPGIYDVNLTIITPAGKRYSFKKEKIIKVIEKSKADFSFQILNKQLPRKVQFIDKTNGEVLDRLWDFGDGSTSTELNPIHEYKYSGDFTVKLIVRDTLGADTLIKYEEILINTPASSVQFGKNNILAKNGISEFKNAFKVSDGFIYISFYYKITTRVRTDILYDYANMLVFNHFDQSFKPLKKDTLQCGKNEVPFFPKPTSLEIQLKEHTFAIDSKYLNDTYKMIYNSKEHKMDVFKSYYFVDFKWIKSNLLKSIDEEMFFSIYDNKNEAVVIQFNYLYEILSTLKLPNSNYKSYIGDTFNQKIDLILQKQNSSYSYFSISPENTIASEKSFSLDTNITLSGIKSVHENLILLYGSYKDDVNNTTYAYFAKYHPLDNTLQDTILYSRKDIRKIERVNNSTYAAIGQSRGRQGYLLLDTNLHQIKDIRVENLTGEIKDMILHDNKVYLFTEKVVSNQTMALGANESYQTTASVLGLPDDIIANVEDSPKIISDKLTHTAYPNPSSDLVNLRVITSETANFSIKLYDIYGNEIIKIHEGSLPAQTEKTFSFPTSQLPIGSYYYVISGDGIIERGKVLVVR